MKVLKRIDTVVERRLLINWRVCPDVAATRVPPPFEPQIVNGYAIVGLCLIRLGSTRPSGLPTWTGVSTENVAHRIAVQRATSTGIERGVYIPRRDTDSWLTVAAAGRVFPGAHHRASFTVNENDGRYDRRRRP